MPRVVLPTTVDCPHCRAKNPAAESRCQSCGKTLTIYIGPAEYFPRRFGLSSLMLLVAVIAPCLAILRASPVLGVITLLLVVPALIRTMSAVSTRNADGRPMVAVEKVGIFTASIGIVWLIGISALMAFGAVFVVVAFVVALLGTIFPGIPSAQVLEDTSLGFLVFAPLGLVASSLVIYWMGRLLWTIKD